MVNVIFNQVLFVQFFGSILVLCTSVYYLSMHIKELSATALLLVYTICIFLQVFVYCWSENEVLIKVIRYLYSTIRAKRMYLTEKVDGKMKGTTQFFRFCEII